MFSAVKQTFSYLLPLTALLFNTPTPSSSWPPCPCLTAQKYGWLIHSALDIPTCLASPSLPSQAYVSHCGGSCQKEGLPLQLCEARGGGGGSRLLILGFGCTCHRALKAAALQGGSSVPTCCFRTWKSSSARSRSVWTSSPAFIASAGGWIHKGKASLFPTPSVQRGALVSALSSCSVFDVINSVSNRVPGTHADISETAFQPAQRPLFQLSCSVHKCQLLSKSPCKKHWIWDHNWRVALLLTPAQPRVSPACLWTPPQHGPQRADLPLACRISALQLWH